MRQEDCQFKASLDYIARPCLKKKWGEARCQWLTPVIVATQEAVFRRIAVLSQPGQLVHKTQSQKNLSQKKKKKKGWWSG
jgi:hypothetical protein